MFFGDSNGTVAKSASFRVQVPSPFMEWHQINIAVEIEETKVKCLMLLN